MKIIFMLFQYNIRYIFDINKMMEYKSTLLQQLLKKLAFHFYMSLTILTNQKTGLNTRPVLNGLQKIDANLQRVDFKLL